MKTIFKKEEGYKRVSDEVADQKVNKEKWKFVPKEEWKKFNKSLNQNNDGKSN